jgi:hypothetical protein
LWTIFLGLGNIFGHIPDRFAVAQCNSKTGKKKKQYKSGFTSVPVHEIRLHISGSVYSFADIWEKRKTADNAAEDILSLSF